MNWLFWVISVPEPNSKPCASHTYIHKFLKLNLFYSHPAPFAHISYTVRQNPSCPQSPPYLISRSEPKDRGLSSEHFIDRPLKITRIIPEIVRGLFSLFCVRVGTGKASAWEEVTPKLAKVMSKSIGRLGRIASVFSRGFRSTASVAMPIKVRLTCFSICGVTKFQGQSLICSWFWLPCTTSSTWGITVWS